MSEKEPSEGIIRLRLAKVDQLFNSLDANAAEYIVAWAREVPHDADIRIRIGLPADELESARARGADQALGNYFGYRADLIQRDQRELFRMSRRHLAIGLVVLMAGLLVAWHSSGVPGL